MIVDSSAVVAVILGEADGPRFTAAVSDSRSARMSAANWPEAAMVIDRRADEAGLRSFDALFGPDGIGIVPLSAYQAELARAAWKRYGRGSGHKAQLNFGDCMAYALARESGEPLLFKGNDFIHTDITPALRD